MNMRNNRCENVMSYYIVITEGRNSLSKNKLDKKNWVLCWVRSESVTLLETLE